VGNEEWIKENGELILFQS